MKDSQFISELLLVLLEEKIIGFDQDYLDESYAKYDNPEEARFNFSKEEFTEKLAQIKDYILSVQKVKKSIINYAKTFANFYSLWSLVALQYKDLPSHEEFTSTYQDFVGKVNQLADSNNPDNLIRGNQEEYNLALKYQQNTLGASTDLSQGKLDVRYLKKF